MTTQKLSKNFGIDALLAHDAEPRTDGDVAATDLYYSRTPVDSPGSNCGSETTSSCPNPTNTSQIQYGLPSKSVLYSLSQSGFAALQAGGFLGLPSRAMYPLAALGGQAPAFMYPGFPHLVQPYPEHLKGGTMAGAHPLEPWIRAGMMIPRLGEYGGECPRLTGGCS